MKTILKRMIAIFVIISVIASALALNWSFYAVADNEDGEVFRYTKDFTKLNPTELDEMFSSAVINSSGGVTVGKPSELWSTSKNPNNVTEGRYQNEYLKPMGNGNTYLLTFKDLQVKNFTASIEFLNSYREYGLYFGQSAPTDLGVNATTTNGTAMVRMQENQGKIIAYGIDNATPEWVGSKSYGEFSRYNDPSRTWTYNNQVISGFDNSVNSTNLHTLNIEVKDGVLKLWWSEYEDIVWKVNLNSKYNGGYVSLYSTGNQQGGIKSFTFAETLEPSVDGADCDFTNIDFVYQLNRDFDAYLVEKDAQIGVKDKASKLWTLSENLPSYENGYKNPWLKPLHRNNGNNTLLTYNKSSYKDFQVATEFVTNYVRYGVMIAPLGEISTPENGGVRVFVESNGVINIQGAIDGATARATGSQVKVTDKNAVSGYPISGFVGPSNRDNNISRTSYTLNVKIVDGVITVWLNEYSDYIITAKLTEKYNGGYVSLYASAYDQGAFKNFKLTELTGSDIEDDGKTFKQSFNSISSLSELESDFDSYLLNSAEEKPVSSNMSDLFLLEKGRLKSNLSKNGTDSSGIAILTLKNKRYENFELTLSYEQDWLRYGVMFGTELGDYAFNSKNNRIIGNGGVVAYTEAEGYTNAKGSMYVSSYTNAAQGLCRKSDINVSSFQSFSNIEKTLQNKPIHSLTVRVVNGYMTMLVDNDETTRITVKLADYDGGYISLITNAAKGRSYGAFYGFTITELDKEAQLEAQIPAITDGFETISQVASEFDAYYLADAEKSTKLEMVDIKEHWWINKGGYLSRITGASGIKETSDVEILTYKKQQFKDFELTYTYQQTYQRIGIMIGGDLKNYPIYFKDGKLAADKGALFFVEAEGYPNVKGHLNNYTSTNYLIYRTTNPKPQGFTDVNGIATDNVNSKKEHTVKIVVKDKKLYAYIDGEKTPYLYVKLGDNYNGGYVSLFACASEDYGIHSFEISDKITTELPKSGGVEVENKKYNANFDSILFDDSAFETYYLDALKNNADGSLIKKEFDDVWTVADGTLKRTNVLEDGSDASKVSVLTYNKKLTNFVVSYDYQKWDKRLMLMFGAEKGKYPLANKGEGDLENGGVLLYPENDLGVGGGIIAIGGISPLTAAYRPVSKKAVILEGYHVIDDEMTTDQNWTSNFGTWHTMTVAVINKHCYIYLDDYGLIADYDLKADYEGGYISLAAAGSQYGFDNISITDLSDISNNTIVSVENPRDITVSTGTKQSEIKLPTSVKATIKGGRTVELPVEWCTNHYDADVEGIYSFTAKLPENANASNTALVSSVINIRVKKTKSTSKTDVKEWTFDTSDDLLDFKSTYLIDGEQGYTENNTARWYCNGELLRDAFRTINGSEKRDISLLTYVGATYHNFELEVDYTQHYTRMGVLFGSDKPCQYINLADIHGENNPVMAFVEYEGVRNFIGNVKNTNFYTRIDETIYNARENGAGLPDYFTEANANTGDSHKMKIRVVGDQVSMWVDDCDVPFTATLTNYDGGYISLVSTTKGGKFDNLKITRLDNNGKPVASGFDIEANGNLDLEIDKDASAELKIPVSKAPEQYEETKTAQVKPTLSTVNVIVGCAIFVSTVVISALFIIAVINKKRKKTK